MKFQKQTREKKMDAEDKLMQFLKNNFSFTKKQEKELEDLLSDLKDEEYCRGLDAAEYFS